MCCVQCGGTGKLFFRLPRSRPGLTGPLAGSRSTRMRVMDQAFALGVAASCLNEGCAHNLVGQASSQELYQCDITHLLPLKKNNFGGTRRR